MQSTTNGPKTILVTGGAGFIGSHLCDALHQQGHWVLCVDDLSLGRRAWNADLEGQDRFTFVECDLLDEDALERALKISPPIDCVFHLAANSDILRGVEDPSIDLRRTFLTTISVLNAVRRRRIGQLVFASSSAVFGELDVPLAEDTGPLLPVSSYGAAKLAAEAFIGASSSADGVQSWIVRFPNVVGPRATHGVIFDFINKLEATPEQLVVLGNGEQSKPYLYVADLVEGMLFVWQNGRERLNRYHLGVESATSVRRIAEIVREEMNLPDAKITYTGGDRGWLGDVPRFRYNLSRVHALGWHARRTSDEAVRLAVRSELEQRGRLS